MPAATPRRGGQGEGEGGDLVRRQGQAVVGEGPGVGRHALDGVEPVHRRPLGPHLAGAREVPRVTEAPRPLGEEVGVKREDDLRLGEVVDPVVRPAQSGDRGEGLVVRRRRLPSVPARLGALGEDRPHLVGEGRRGDRTGQDAHPQAAQRLLGLEERRRLVDEGPPGADAAKVDDRLRAVGVVEVEHRGLGEDVGRPQARRVVGVALDLRRPAGVALGEHPVAVAALDVGAGEVERLARHDLLRLADVGDDPFERLLGAAGQTGEPQRGAGELEEGAAGDPVVGGLDPLRGLAGELAVQPLLKVRGAGELV